MGLPKGNKDISKIWLPIPKEGLCSHERKGFNGCGREIYQMGKKPEIQVLWDFEI